MTSKSLLPSGVVCGVMAILALSPSCRAPSETSPANTGVSSRADGPLLESERFRVYTRYTPQVQRRDFNGVFDISPEGARIVRRFWKERFNELTRADHYGEYFIEFYDYMASLAQSYGDMRQREIVLESLENSFQTLCLALGISEEFEDFRDEQERIYDDG